MARTLRYLLPAMLLIAATAGTLAWLGSGYAVTAAKWVEYRLGSPELANALRSATISLAEGSPQASLAHRGLVLSLGLHLRYGTRLVRRAAWQYACHEHTYRSIDELRSAVGLGAFLLWERSEADDCVEFITAAQRQWPELAGCNSINHQLITAYVSLSRYREAV